MPLGWYMLVSCILSHSHSWITWWMDQWAILGRLQGRWMIVSPFWRRHRREVYQFPVRQRATRRNDTLWMFDLRRKTPTPFSFGDANPGYLVMLGWGDYTTLSTWYTLTLGGLPQNGIIVAMGFNSHFEGLLIFGNLRGGFSRCCNSHMYRLMRNLKDGSYIIYFHPSVGPFYYWELSKPLLLIPLSHHGWLLWWGSVFCSFWRTLPEAWCRNESCSL